MSTTRVQLIDKNTTVGTAAAEDTKIVFDGNAQDFHIGLDDSADSLIIGKGSALGTTSNIVIDENGHVTKPLQPAFAAKPASNQSDINAVDAYVTILFGTEIFDQNGDFAPSPYGIFTAPVTGKYQLQVNLYVSDFDASADYLQLDIVTSNRNYSALWETGSEDTYLTMNVVVLADMDASDTASVRIYQGGGGAQVDVRVPTVFSGHLVC
tara:strand:+ start:42 stop:671 length:630 start_codon:yes stop_codon:yes gene_type:complete